MYGFFQRTSPSAYYSDLETEFGLDGAGIGSLSSAYFYAYAIAQIPYGIAMDKYGPLIVVSMCSLFTFAAALLFSLSESLFFTYVGRSLVGFFVGVAWIASVKSIQDEAYFDGKKQILTGFSMSLGMLGGTLGQGPLAALVNASGWRFAMSITSIVPLTGFVVASTVFFLKSKLLRAEDNQTNSFSDIDTHDDTAVVPVRCSGATKNDAHVHESLECSKDRSQTTVTTINILLKALRMKTNIYMMLYFMFAFVNLLAFASLWAVPFFTQVGKVNQAAAGIAATFYIVGTGIGSPVGGAISDRFKGRKRHIMIFALCLTTTFTLLVVLGTGTWFSIYVAGFLMFIAGLGQGPHMVVFFVAKEQNPKDLVGTALAIINIGGILAGAFFQPLLGAVLDIGWDGKVGSKGERLWDHNHMRITFSLMLTVCNAIAFLIVVFLIPKDNARDEGCVERHVIEDDERREVV